MLADSYIVPECIVSPGSFGGLMAMYEGNFIKLDRLVGLQDGVPVDSLSMVANGEQLSMTLESREKYTYQLRLTYLFDDPDGVVYEPDLKLKVYLDARMAEVRGWANYHRHPVLLGLSARFDSELNRRWSENMMLSKWLDYLLDCGHSFVGASEPAAALLEG